MTYRVPLLVSALVLAAVAGTAVLAPLPPEPALPAALPGAGARPDFHPEAFFAGRSHGDPLLSIRMRRAQRLRVESVGAAQADGGFRLDQTITYPGGRVTERAWTMRQAADGTYESALTPDARGPVRVTPDGPRLRIRYRMGRVTTMDQLLTLRPGGQVADNVATVRMLGMPIARITETITRDTAPADTTAATAVR